MKFSFASIHRRTVIIGAIGLTVITIGSYGVTQALTNGGSSPKTPIQKLTDAIGMTTGQKPPEKIATFPLTGEPSNGDSKADRPMVVVKIDNSPQARPQYGIGSADIYLEEKVEGGITRIMAVFQSSDADSVGPVRSLRSTDIFALRPFGGGIIAFSGGIAPFKSMLPQAQLADFSEDAKPGLYSRMRGREYVHSLTTSTQKVRAETPTGLHAPKPLFTYLKPNEAFAAEGAQPANSLGATISKATSISWTWDANAKVWKRGINGGPHNLTSGQIAVKNAIVQYVDYRPTPYTDRAKSPVDEAVLVGSGDAWVLCDGKALQAHWNRASDDAETIFTDSAGKVINLQPGKTWVTYTPKGQPSTLR